MAIGALVFTGCGAAPGSEPVLPPPAPAAPMTLPPLQVTATPAGAAAPTSYEGHGLASLPPEVLAKYRPRPLPAEVSRRIQAMHRLSGPGHRRGLARRQDAVLQLECHRRVSSSGGSTAPMRFPVAAHRRRGHRRSCRRSRPTERARGLARPQGRGEPRPLSPTARRRTAQPIQHMPGPDVLRRDLARFEVALLHARTTSRRTLTPSTATTSKSARETVVDRTGLWSVADLADDGRLLLHRATGALPPKSRSGTRKRAAHAALRPEREGGVPCRYGARPGESSCRRTSSASSGASIASKRAS